jgi:hypothetical protein
MMRYHLPSDCLCIQCTLEQIQLQHGIAVGASVAYSPTTEIGPSTVQDAQTNLEINTMKQIDMMSAEMA